MQGFSTFGEQRVLSVAVHGLFTVVSSFTVEHRLEVHGLQELQSMVLVALRHVGSSQTRDRTSVPCIERQILNNWTTREALTLCILFIFGFYHLLHTGTHTSITHIHCAY